MRDMDSRPSIRTQILLFTLFGEYIVPRGGSAWTSSLLELLKVLGVSERAARSTLSRMSQKRWFVSTREGRFSKYALTSRGMRVVQEGQVRIFEPRRTAWDGLWHMVVYSVPEGKRRLRSSLRTRLGWLGFGRLAPGTWISPNDRRQDIEADADDLGARPYVVYFGGMRLYFISNEQIVDRCWDLASINADYARFLRKYEGAFSDSRNSLTGGPSMPPWECFRQRFWLTLEYAQFPRRDPNLPPELLPEGWFGTRASQLFHELHGRLEVPSETFVSETLERGPDGPYLRSGNTPSTADHPVEAVSGSEDEK